MKVQSKLGGEPKGFKMMDVVGFGVGIWAYVTTEGDKKEDVQRKPKKKEKMNKDE